MADRHMEAAAEAMMARGFGRNPAETYAREAVTGYLSSLLGELPPEAERAAHDSLDVVDGRNWAGATRSEMVDAILPAFLQSLRDSLASGTGQQHED